MVRGVGYARLFTRTRSPRSSLRRMRRRRCRSIAARSGIDTKSWARIRLSIVRSISTERFLSNEEPRRTFPPPPAVRPRPSSVMTAAEVAKERSARTVLVAEERQRAQVVSAADAEQSSCGRRTSRLPHRTCRLRKRPPRRGEKSDAAEVRETRPDCAPRGALPPAERVVNGRV